jgi:protein tyrosine phosphatase (PTP) superfamily phosphohydrolase (DUF442 family)
MKQTLLLTPDLAARPSGSLSIRSPLERLLRRLLPSRQRLWRPIFGTLVLCLLLPLGWVGWLQASGNFHSVIEGEMYRSAQPSETELEAWVRAKGIRSVLNLRGASEQDWYGPELDASRRLGIVHADFSMRASARLPAARARELVALMQSLPKPLLIHCKAGADRTGLAAALYLAATGRGESSAENQLSFRYGHVSLPSSKAWPMDESWQAIKGDILPTLHPR